MRKAILIAAVLTATVAVAQSQFRQRIRHVEVHGDVWTADDGSTVSEFTLIADPEHPLVDGGTWPLKVRVINVDGGMPNAVINTGARRLEARNGLDGGLQ
jgi:hypothetical protein